MSQTVEEIKQHLSCASLHRSGWTIERSAARSENVIAATALKIEDPALYKGKKTIIDPKIEPWQEIQTIRNYAGKWWDYNTFPYVEEGQRLFLRERRAELWDKMKDLDTAIKSAAAKLDARRSEILTWAKKKLGDTYDESLYPKSWESEFSISLREHNIDPPQYLKREDSEEYKRELARTLRDIESSMKLFERQCYTQMGETAAALAANLGGNRNNGIGSNIESFRKLFNRVQQMKFEGTAAFKRAMKEAQEIIDGVEVDELRDDKGLRSNTKERIEALMKKYKDVQEAALKKAQKKVSE